MKSIWTFGCNEWRIESEPSIITGISNLELYANDELVFEGSYVDLIKKITKE